MSQDAGYVVEVQFKSARKLSELVIVLDDLKVAAATLYRLRDECEKPDDQQSGVIVKALWTAAVTLYGRVFDNSATRKQKIMPDMFNELAGGSDSHKHFIRLRNMHIAHDFNPWNQCKVGVTLSPLTAKTKEIIEVTKFAMFAIPNSEEVRTLGTLVEFAQSKIEKEIKDQTDEVLADAKNQSIDWLYGQRKLEMVVPSAADMGQNRRGWKPSKRNGRSS